MDQLGNLKRTTLCGDITEEYIDQRVTVMGWVDRRRDLGSLIFLDLRDREGIVQVVASPDQPLALEKAREVRPEHVLAITGPVVWRDQETVNPQIPTGRLEIRAEEIRLLNSSQTPPFPIAAAASASEETRLHYRFLDLRRRPLQRNLRLRHQMCLEIRKFLDQEGFLEIETPFLTKSTPEGARDYLVPSRLHPGHFYALPQSPQLFKQLLMISGFDRYFQIVRCFRDEDLRADRQPEFTQVDLEISFPQMETVFEIVE
ncbi:aspartate--tRNA ligase, partial [Acidobacteria bacterium AH-259-D05]|nr:aspartate--tRNA ligase [Acidobacteria bacterium AH-259-D05]